MKFNYGLLPVLTTLLSASLLPDEAEEELKYVHYPVQKQVVSNDQVFNDIEFVNNKRVTKRDGNGNLQFIIENQQSYYSVKLVIGSNKQELSALLDTGSSDLWVLGSFGNNVSACDAYLQAAGYISKKRDLEVISGSNAAHRVIPDFEDDLGQEEDYVDATKRQQSAARRVIPDFEDDLGQDDDHIVAAKRQQSASHSMSTIYFTASADLASYLSELTATATGSGSGSTSTSHAVQQEIELVENNCAEFGVFTPSKSSSFKKNNSASIFSIQYGDNTFANGFWGSDKLNINGVSVDGMLFGVANVSNSSNVLGISFPQLESSNSGNTAFTYSNLPQLLKQQGLVNKVSYSLFLNSLDATAGDLLFGAVDSAKYVGQLYTVPLINIFSKHFANPIQFDITLQGTGFISVTGKPYTFNTQNIPALLDSGTTLLYLPQSLANMFAKQIGASWDNNLQYYTLTCPSDNVNQGSAYVFQIGGVNYYVPLANYILKTSDKNTCALGIQPQQTQYVILGDNTLSALYVVYDLEDYQIAIAQADFSGSSKSNIQVISNSIPGASQAPGYSNTWSGSVLRLTTETNNNALFSNAPKNPWTATSSIYFQSTSINTHAMAGGESDGSVATLTSSPKSKTATSTGTSMGTQSATSATSDKQKNNANGLIAGGNSHAVLGVFHALAALIISLI